MKKTIAAAVIASMMTTTAAPAFAGDEAMRLGIGLGIAVLGQMMKGGKNHGGKKGGTLVGRVGDRQTQGQNRKRTGGKATAAVAGAGAAAVALVALPAGEKAPIPVAKPTPEELAAWNANPASHDQSPDPFSSPIPSQDETAQIDESVPLYDEQGRFWGEAAPAQVEKIEAAIKLGMKPSDAIPALTGLKLDANAQATPVQQANDIPIVSGADMAQAAGIQPHAEKPRSREGEFGTRWTADFTKGFIVDEDNNAWGDASAAEIEQVDAATRSGMKRSEAIVRFTAYAEPGRTKTEVAEREAREAQARAENEARIARFNAQLERDKKEAFEKRRQLVAQMEAERKAEAEKAEAEAKAEQVRAEAEAKAAQLEAERQAEAERQKAEAEALLGSKLPAATASSEPAPPVPAVDERAKTASVIPTPEAAPIVPKAADKATAQKPADKAKKPKLDL